VGWLWVEQALAAHRGLERGHEPNPDFYYGKLHAAQYFFDWVVAGTRSTHEALRRLDDSALVMKPEWF
jgi:butyryl-CoA dehydrogenase